VIVPEDQDAHALPTVTYMASGDGLEGYHNGYVSRACGKIVPPYYDLAAARNWLLQCIKSHGETRDSPLTPVSGLSAIDYSRRAVVRLPEKADHVTLSYIWGTPQSENVGPITGLPGQLPAVVSDAIGAVRLLDLDYIWVDLHCIPGKSVKA
jgi:hypothetical protein